MRVRACTTVLAAVIVVSLAGIFPANAEVAADEPYPVELFVGEIFEVCTSGQIACPAIAPICDNPNVSAPVDAPAGLGFEGKAPGTTLCSAAAATGQRRVFRIIVR